MSIGGNAFSDLECISPIENSLFLFKLISLVPWYLAVLDMRTNTSTEYVTSVFRE